MTKEPTTDNLIKPAASKAESKAKTTDRAARAIIDAEASAREAKTAKLREARIAMEEAQEDEKLEAAKLAKKLAAKIARKAAAKKKPAKAKSEAAE